jgi:hypothetical protein
LPLAFSPRALAAREVALNGAAPAADPRLTIERFAPERRLTPSGNTRLKSEVEQA